MNDIQNMAPFRHGIDKHIRDSNSFIQQISHSDFNRNNYYNTGIEQNSYRTDYYDTKTNTKINKSDFDGYSTMATRYNHNNYPINYKNSRNVSNYSSGYSDINSLEEYDPRMSKKEYSNIDLSNRTSKNTEPKDISKRPMNGFMLFAKRMRVILSNEYHGKDNRYISVLLGEKWKQLTQDERNEYSLQAKNFADERRRINPNCWKRHKK